MNVNVQASHHINFDLSQKEINMILQITKDQLKWEDSHHQDFARLEDVQSIVQAELFNYNNDQISVKSTLKIVEHSNRDNNFELISDNYSHVHPELIRLEFKDVHKIGDYATIEEAKDAAQVYFNHHHHTKFNTH